MQSEFIAAINQIAAEKNMPKDIVMEAVIAAFKTAYRKQYGNRNQDLDVEIDEVTQTATVYLVKTVAKEIEDEDLDILLADAKKYKKDAKVGEEIRIDVTPAGGYGRIAAQAAKQVIIQKIQEAEREIIYTRFKDREHELIDATVHKVEKNHVYLKVENLTIPLSDDQRIPGEHLNPGQHIKLYLERVIKTSKGPQILISRTHPELIRKLMEVEIPEIEEGIVEIKAIAREAGLRCKVAVYSNDPKIDAIGSAVGQKGVRIQTITNEIGHERIDIIPWNDNPAKFLESALAPATISRIEIDEKHNRASVFVHFDQRALAIGKGGQNVRLASKLSGMEVDILDLEEEEESDKLDLVTVDQIPGLDEAIIEKLKEMNLSQVEQLKGLSVTDFEGVGLEAKEAEQLVDKMKKVR